MKIEYGYDRHVRGWCILVLDSEGNQIDSSYVGDKKGLNYEINHLKEKYQLENMPENPYRYEDTAQYGFDLLMKFLDGDETVFYK